MAHGLDHSYTTSFDVLIYINIISYILNNVKIDSMY